MLDAMLKDMREKQPERIIAIGGGSVIDCAKLFVLEGTASAEDMFLHRCTPEKSRELIAIPTTCGSGRRCTVSGSGSSDSGAAVQAAVLLFCNKRH